MERIDYSGYAGKLATMSPAAFADFVARELPRLLCDAWCADYQRAFRDAEIVAVPLERFTYLFDLTGERNIAAYGIMGGKNTMVRDHGRMAGYPKSEGRAYHRGHMMPHSGGGGTDINLFIQSGAVNIGPFRELEKTAIAHPGSFYFVRLLYGLGPSQRPASVEQGVFVNGKPPKMETRFFSN